ncbi:hypothetical protein ACHWQZ_G006610 [Mnemiopsis leidyi]
MEVGLANNTGVETLVNLSKSHHHHVHKNFTVPGLFLNYVVGFIAFSVLYLFSYDIHWKYYKLDRKRVNMFVYTVRFVRIVHAVMATLVAVPIMLITTEFLKDRYLILDMFVAMSGGYLTFDVVGKYNEHLQVYEPAGKLISYRIIRRYVRKNWLLLAHHAFLVIFVYPSVLFARDDEGDFVVACLLFTELSVPFTEMQWIMEQTLEPYNLRYTIVSMCAIATTVVCRILIVPFLYEALADHMGMSVLDFTLSLAPWWHIAALAYLVPNVFWLGRNIFKTMVYLRIPYERKRKAKPGEKIDRSKLPKEEKRLKED